MYDKNTTRWHGRLIALFALFGAGIVLLTTTTQAERGQTDALDPAIQELLEEQAAEERKKDADGKEDRMRVGVYHPQQVFTSSKLGERMQRDFEEIHRELQSAQQEGDQQRMEQLQMRAQQAQQQLIASFEQNIERIIPRVAREEEVQLVAMEILYAAEEVETRDLTEAVVKHLDAAMADDPERPQEPQQPQLPQQFDRP